MTRRLLLVGGGHAHLEVLREAARRAFPAELVLVSPYARQLYSAMMPAQLRTGGDEHVLGVELGELCRAAGARFVEAAATRLEVGSGGGVVHADGAVIEGDWLSLDVGATTAGLRTPGAAEHAYTVRPLSRWRSLVERVKRLSEQTGSSPVSCCVVGGGAGGVELALALAGRCDRAGRPFAVTVVEQGQRLATGLGDRGGQRATHILQRRGVTVAIDCTVARVGADAVTLADGRTLPSDVTVWVTGAAPLPLAAAAGLPTNDAGFFEVDATLRSIDGRPVWGAGDCVALAGEPWVPRAGVYAVRAAPVLAHNLRSAAAGDLAAMRPYHPQRHALAILDTADRRGLLRWRALVVHTRWALALKRRIDRRFVRRYQRVAAAAAAAAR